MDLLIKITLGGICYRVNWWDGNVWLLAELGEGGACL